MVVSSIPRSFEGGGGEAGDEANTTGVLFYSRSPSSSITFLRIDLISVSRYICFMLTF